jgi:hypothetical protein
VLRRRHGNGISLAFQFQWYQIPVRGRVELRAAISRRHRSSLVCLHRLQRGQGPTTTASAWLRPARYHHHPSHPGEACRTLLWRRLSPQFNHESLSGQNMSQFIPPAPPPPPPKKQRSYFERFVAQPLTTAYGSRPPSVQTSRPDGNPLVPKLPGYVRLLFVASCSTRAAPSFACYCSRPVAAVAANCTPDGCGISARTCAVAPSLHLHRDPTCQSQVLFHIVPALSVPCYSRSLSAPSQHPLRLLSRFQPQDGP